MVLKMKVLFAIGDAVWSEKVVKEYYSLYNETLEYKNVFYFKAILDEVKKDKSYDRIVIAERLEPKQNNVVDVVDQILFNNIDSITDEVEDSTIILICDDDRNKNDTLIGRLFNIGIYNLLMGDEREISNLCKLIRNPRNKKDAKEYLHTNPAVSGSNVVEDDGVNEIELLNVCKHFEGLSSPAQYLQSFAIVEEQYTQKDLEVIVTALCQQLTNGRDIYNALKSDSRYAKYCIINQKDINSGLSSVENVKKGILGFISSKAEKMTAKNPIGAAFKSNKNNFDEEAERKKREEQQARFKQEQQRHFQESQEARLKSQQNTNSYNPSSNVNTYSPSSINNSYNPSGNTYTPSNTQNTYSPGGTTNTYNPSNVGGSSNTYSVGTTNQYGSGSSDNSYGTTSSGYGTSSSGYGTGSSSYGSDSSNSYSSGSSNQYGAGTSGSSYTSGSSGYGSSSSGYGSSGYGSGSSSYGTDSSNTYNSGSSNQYGTGASGSSYGSSSGGYGSSSSGYGSSSSGYGSSSSGYGSSSTGYGAGSSSYGTDSSNTYNSGSSNQYGAGASGSSYGVGSNGYGSSSSGYGTGSSTYGADSSNTYNPGNTNSYGNNVAGGYSTGANSYGGYGATDSSSNPYASQYGNAGNPNDYGSYSVTPNSTATQSPISNNSTSISNVSKTIAVVGAPGIGTTFIVNILGTIASQRGVKTAMLDITKNKGLYWFYSDDTYKRTDIVENCFSSLGNGQAKPVSVGRNRNLDLYTTIPGGKESSVINYKHRQVLDTAKSNCQLLIIDCDFDTPLDYFDYATEIYIVHDLNLLNVPKTQTFLKKMKSKNVNWSKLKMIINNSVKSSITAKKVVKNALTYASDPNMTYTEEYPEIKDYYEIPLDSANYSNYIDSMESGKINFDRFTDNFKKAFNSIADIVIGSDGKKKGLF